MSFFQLGVLLGNFQYSNIYFLLAVGSQFVGCIYFRLQSDFMPGVAGHLKLKM